MREFIDLIENAFDPKIVPVLYHGTTDRYADSIAKIGLRPQSETNSPLRGNDSTIDGYTAGNIYLTDDLWLAKIYARLQARELGGKPIIYQVRIPDPHKLVLDDDYIHYSKRNNNAIDLNNDHFKKSLKHNGSVAYRGRIPASFLTPIA